MMHPRSQGYFTSARTGRHKTRIGWSGRESRDKKDDYSESELKHLVVWAAVSLPYLLLGLEYPINAQINSD